MTHKGLTVRLLLSVLLVLAPLAVAADEEEAGFEGWDEESGDTKKDEEKKNSSATAGESAKPGPKPTPAPSPEPVNKPEVGMDAKTAGSHEGLLPSVQHEYGSLALMGLFQTLFDTTIILDDNNDTETLGFTFQRARIMLKGHLLTRNLEYFFQGDAKNMLSFALDMYVKYKYRGFSLRVGRFLPDFTYMMPRNKGDLAAIEHPLMLTYGGFAPWRQIGAEIGYQANDQFGIKFGVFNGLLYEPTTVDPYLVNAQMGSVDIGGVTYTNYTDNNMGKDFLLRANYMATSNLSLDLNFWLGMPENAVDGDEIDIVIIGGPGVEYNDGKLHLITEFLFRIVSYDDPTDTRTGLALWAHAGYFFTDWLEAIFRADWVEPNLDDDTDMRLRLTTGAHFLVEKDHFRILANFFVELPLEDDPAPSLDEVIGILVQASLMW
jgi:hypothetical protein